MYYDVITMCLMLEIIDQGKLVWSISKFIYKLR